MKIRKHLFLITLLCATLTSGQSVQATTHTVTSAIINGPGSLWEAIYYASAGDTINFDSSLNGQTITATFALYIFKNLTIIGPGANRLTINGNAANQVFDIPLGITATISGLTITNGGPQYSGGGIYNEGTTAISNCTISSNIARGQGGGIYNSGSLTLTACTIANNTASAPDPQRPKGGGIYNTGQLAITNCTISGNQALGGNGGGIYSSTNLGVTISSSTIVFNNARTYGGAGGGIYAPNNNVEMTSTILALNQADTSYDGNYTIQTDGYNLIGDTDGIFIAPLPTDQVGTHANPINPLIGSLSNNGGPTYTHALQAGSRAIDHGSPSSPPHDQRGYGRLGVPDIGAVEFVSGPISQARYDFNGDGHPDYLLYNAGTRQTRVWYLNNNVYQGGAAGPTPPSGWNLIDAADFNGDGHPDYLLFNSTTHATRIWYMNNNVHVGGANGPTLPSVLEMVALGDFNRDGHPDYLLFNSTTHATRIWYMNNNVHVGTAAGPTLPGAWQVAGVADFNQDGKLDYVLFNSATRQSAICYLNNNVVVGVASGPTIASGYVLRGADDFNGDGKPDYVLCNLSTRRTAIWYMNNNVYISGAYGPTLPVGWTLPAL